MFKGGIQGILNKSRSILTKNFGTETQRILASMLYDDQVEVLTTFDMNRIATLTFGDEVCAEIFDVIEYTLRNPIEFTVLTIHKCIVLLHHLSIYASQKAANATWILKPIIEPLQNYNTVLLALDNPKSILGKIQSIKGGSVDRGLPVRKAAKQLYDLLSNVELFKSLRSQREDPNSLVPVGNKEEVGFVSEDLQQAMIQEKMRMETCSDHQIHVKSNLKTPSDAIFGAGYASKDGSAVVGAAHGLEEMLKLAEQRSKKKYSDTGIEKDEDRIHKEHIRKLKQEFQLTQQASSVAASKTAPEVMDLLDFGNDETTTTTIAMNNHHVFAAAADGDDDEPPVVIHKSPSLPYPYTKEEAYVFPSPSPSPSSENNHHTNNYHHDDNQDDDDDLLNLSLSIAPPTMMTTTTVMNDTLSSSMGNMSLIDATSTNGTTLQNTNSTSTASASIFDEKSPTPLDHYNINDDSSNNAISSLDISLLPPMGGSSTNPSSSSALSIFPEIPTELPPSPPIPPPPPSSMPMPSMNPPTPPSNHLMSSSSSPSPTTIPSIIPVAPPPSSSLSSSTIPMGGIPNVNSSLLSSSLPAPEFNTTNTTTTTTTYSNTNTNNNSNNTMELMMMLMNQQQQMMQQHHQQTQQSNNINGGDHNNNHQLMQQMMMMNQQLMQQMMSMHSNNNHQLQPQPQSQTQPSINNTKTNIMNNITGEKNDNNGSYYSYPSTMNPFS